MKNILVVFTGGTIGSKFGDDSINVGRSSYFILDSYSRITDRLQDVEFEPIQPINQLSENLHPQDWTLLYHALIQAKYEHYDGVIVTHGSDTLAYTAIAMSYMFAGSPVPIVMIASNMPIDHPESNGLLNFKCGVEWIVRTGLPGVFAIYQDQYKHFPVHLGTRIQQCRPFTDDFESTYNKPFAIIGEDGIRHHTFALNPSPQLLKQYTERANKRKQWFDEPSFSDEIVSIRPYPGIQYPVYTAENWRPKAILLDSYHSGTVNIRALNGKSVLDMLESCQEHDIPVYITLMKNPGAAVYDTTKQLLDYGVKPLYHISYEASLVKLMLAYGCVRSEQISVFLRQELFFEHHCNSAEGKTDDMGER